MPATGQVAMSSGVDGGAPFRSLVGGELGAAAGVGIAHALRLRARERVLGGPGFGAHRVNSLSAE